MVPAGMHLLQRVTGIDARRQCGSLRHVCHRRTYRWPKELGYLLANSFSGIKLRGASKGRVVDASHVFTLGKWGIVRAITDGLEWSYGWQEPAAQRLRFILDFACLTGLRASELVGVALRSIATDGHDGHWLQFIGKGSNPERSRCRH